MQLTGLHSTISLIKYKSMRIFGKLFFASLFICVFACSEKNVSSLTSTISILETGENILEGNVFIDKIDTLPLKNKGEHFSTVQAICVTDSSIYIIDKTGSIGCFNIKTGCIDKKIRKVGHGNDEYINPVSICEDRGYLYVLDFQGCAVLVYDYKLNYKGRIKLEFPAMDFVKIPDGFLFYNMNASEQFRRIVHTNAKGVLINSYLSPTHEDDVMQTDKSFCKDDNGETYFSDFSNNCLYKWEDGNLTSLYQIEIKKMKNKRHSSKKASSPLDGRYIRSFVINNQIITLYIQDGMVLANSYNGEIIDSHSGRVKTNIPYPFFPITSYKKSLYGIYEKMDADNNDDVFMMLISYKIKE